MLPSTPSASGTRSMNPGPEVPPPGREARGAHAGALERFVAESPPFRPEATAEELVEAFSEGETRFPAYLSLHRRGETALPAVRAGLRHADWHVRQWCALFLDQHADQESLEALVPLLRDPKSRVRLWAVHSISCVECKDGPTPVDAIPLLLERIAEDESIRVRRHAVAMLAGLPPDERVTPVFRRILEEEEDPKLRLHAQRGLDRYAESGLAD